MNAIPRRVVCISHNFPPQNDAESLCTARVLSSLSDSGWEIHLITADHARTLDESIEREIVSPHIRVTRVPVPKAGRLRRMRAMARHAIHAPLIEWARPAIRAARDTLSRHPCSILMTRAMPIVSNIAGYACRDLAAAWVAHFSDPYPDVVHKRRSRWSGMAWRLHAAWARRIVAGADIVTVTCPNAVRYLQTSLSLSLGPKAQVLTHLALPTLKPGTFRFDREPGEFWLAHIGNLMADRNPAVLLKGISMAARRIPALRFLQYGHIDAQVLTTVEHEGLDRVLVMRHIDNLNPRDATDLRCQVDVNVVADLDCGMDYSPFMPSKYPHAVCSGKPLLILTHPDSMMSDMTRNHGGGICASYRDPEQVFRAILTLYESWRRKAADYIPTPALMNEFAAGTIVHPLLERLTRLLDHESTARSKVD